MSGSFDTEGYFRLRSRSTREETSGPLEDTGPSHEEVPGDSTLSHPGQERGREKMEHHKLAKKMVSQSVEKEFHFHPEE